jgi:NADH/NAD ratio-sensing transcriptional regulator Rex
MADRLYKRWGENLTIALVGFQNKIAEALIDRFSKDNIDITDLDKDNIGKNIKGVEIKDGRQWTEKAVEKNFLALVSGTTIINNTAEYILKLSKKDNKSRIVIFYGTSISGIASLLGFLRRLCLKSH